MFLSSAVNTFEWYDYALFGHFASLIGSKFFPNTEPRAVLLQAFLLFAIGYLARPIGGAFFGIIGDRFGRKIALSASLICMAFPTAIISILPTYNSIGLTATILMIIVRILQGLSMGGALTGSISFAIEHTDKSKRGFIGSISMASICLGILLGSAVSHLIQMSLTPIQFDQWGWRLPFLMGILIFFIGLYVRRHTEETPMFLETQKTTKISQLPLIKIIENFWPDMLVSIMINATGSVIFYLQAVYLMNYLKISRGFADLAISSLLSYCYIIMAFTTVLIGYLSDIIGRRRLFAVILITIIIAIGPLLHIFQTGNFNQVCLAQIIISILAAAYIGPEPALQAELYPTKVRSTALSISYNIAVSLFGGTTPFVLEMLLQKNGDINASHYYIIFCSIMSLTALYFYKNRSIE